VTVQLSLLNFQAIVQQSAAAMQAACSALLNLTPGSVLRAILEANASVVLWIENLIFQVLQVARLATSSGTDVDSFVNDFTMTRLPAVAASGSVTFSRLSPASSIASVIVPYFNADGTINTAGVQVITADGTQTFGVVTDTTNAAWNATMGGYFVAPATASVTVTVQALVAGTGGNVIAGAISLLAVAVAGIDVATNPAPFVNGVNAETDAAVKARFQNFINTRSEATTAAVEYAIQSLQQGLTYSIVPNTDGSGNYVPGNFVVYVDNGTGDPPSSLLTVVQAAINAVCPIGSTFSVFPPTVVTANVSMTITVGPNGNKPTIQGEVENALDAYIDALGLDAGLPWSRLAQIAYDTDPNVTNVSSLLLNGGTSDIAAASGAVIRAGTTAIN
jgi:uncharacterized phage protein gp47/JayE